MFIHNFVYTLKILFKNKMLIFWTYAFPLILATFFNLAFSNIENSEKLDIIDIAVVKTEKFNSSEIYKETLSYFSDDENENRLFNISFVSEDEAQNLLKEGKITGYLLLLDSPKVVINSNGVNETIFKNVIDQIAQTEKITNTIVLKYLKSDFNTNFDYSSLYNKITKEVSNILESNSIMLENISSNNLSYTMIEYYTLIAMTCLYGAILGVVVINYSLPNMSSNGKRISVSPSSKRKIISSGLLASYITQVVGIALLFMYTIFILKIDYGTNLKLIILLALVGCLSGLALGIAVCSLLKQNEDVKTGIVIAVTMFGCFLSGMMGITMKYVIDKNVPIINKLNPANMITDGLYSLYYYTTLDRYWFNILSLIIFTIILLSISIINLRRQKYDSI